MSHGIGQKIAAQVQGRLDAEREGLPFRQDERDDFIDAYLEALFWVMDDEEPRPDEISLDLFAENDREQITSDCNGFIDANLDDLREAMRRYVPNNWTTAEQAGHDFLLTRNGHGAGFWDRGIGDVGDRLTEASKPFGDQTAWVADDGTYFLMG